MCIWETLEKELLCPIKDAIIKDDSLDKGNCSVAMASMSTGIMMKKGGGKTYIVGKW